MEKDPFKEYLKETEPEKAYKGYAWSTAIGLQAVDGLKPSEYLLHTAVQNIEGKITMKEAQSLIDSQVIAKLAMLVRNLEPKQKWNCSQHDFNGEKWIAFRFRRT